MMLMEPAEPEGNVYDVIKQFKDVSRPKNIIISFDGTGATPKDAVQEESCDDKLYGGDTGLGNCCKLHLIAGGNIGNSYSEFDDFDDETKIPQMSLYYSGVGTRGGFFMTLKQATGAGAMEDIYSMAYEDLQKCYKEGDKLFIFGFSRGASTARLFCSYLTNNPIGGFVPEVAFLGVFDTVCESFRILGGVGLSDDPKVLDVNRKDGNMPGNVETAVHLVCIDECRGTFSPTLFYDDPRVTEIWCPGVHSDIGGGYYHDGLSDIALVYMKTAAEKAGMRCREITTEMNDDPVPRLVKDGFFDDESLEKFKDFDKDKKIEPDALDPDIHSEMSWVYTPTNILTRFKTRTPRVLTDDAVGDGESPPILLLDAAVERVKNWEHKHPEMYEPRKESYSGNKYRPTGLLGRKYRVVTLADKSYSAGEIASMSIPEEDKHMLKQGMSVSKEIYNCISEQVDVW